MKSLPHTLLLLTLLPATLLLCGCPHHIEKVMEDIESQTLHNPVYIGNSVSLDKIVEKYKGQVPGTGGVNPGTGTATGTTTDPATGTATGTTTDPATGTTAGTTAGATSSGSIPLALKVRNVDDSRYPNEVELRAIVHDTTGQLVMGLAPPYFTGSGTYRKYWTTLVDSCAGNAVTIDSFDVTEVREIRREPYALAFVLDHSGSMRDEVVRSLQSAVGKVLQVIKKGDQVSVVKFAGQVRVEVPLTGDTAIYLRQFQARGREGMSGGTAIYDAAIRAITEVAKAPERHKRAIIIFTDGSDNSSDSTIEALHRIARQQRVAVYTVGYFIAFPPIDETVMRNIAGATGGRYYKILNHTEFIKVFKDIYLSFGNYYRITYRPPECAGIHTASVSLAIPELNNLSLADKGTYDRSIFTLYDPIGTVAFVNIEFDYDKSTIRSESIGSIQRVADALKAYPKMRLEVRGHTDDRGGDEYNQKLSQQRAAEVVEALEDMGIASARLQANGFGKSVPLVPNDSEENRRKNRRTEFVIISR